jgi:serine/threonine-protein kinase
MTQYALHPLHPAAWIVDQVQRSDWTVDKLLCFTRASTLILVRDGKGGGRQVLKAGFGSDHVLAELPDDLRSAAYGFYWYAEKSPAERALARADFQHEIQITRQAAGTDHVVPLLADGDLGRFDWYTMPYYPAGNFRSFLTPANVGATSARRDGLHVLADVAAGLAGLHRAGIVHRDIYHENILIDDGRGLITDFGAARTMATPRGPAARGPEVHWPPEYAHGYATATPAADVFSLAVLAFRFLTGDIPRLHGRLAISELPQPLRETISAALAPDPRDRPGVAILAEALTRAAQSAPVS